MEQGVSRYTRAIEISENCHCLCISNHPNHMGVCLGEATATLRFSNFPSSSVLAGIFDSVDVQMCQPCREKTLEKARAEA